MLNGSGGAHYGKLFDQFVFLIDQAFVDLSDSYSYARNQRIGPFAQPGNIVQNQPCWDACYVVGHPTKSNSYRSSLTFLCFGCSTA